MSKKALRKVFDPLKLPDPLDLWGEKAAQQQKMAKQQAQAQEEQARQQAAQAAEASAQAQRQIAIDGERQQAQAAAAEAQQVDTALPTLELAGDATETIAQKRKRFQGAAVGTPGAAASLRV